MPYLSIIGGGPRYSKMIADELKTLGAKVDTYIWFHLFPLPHNLELPQWDLIHLRIGGATRMPFMLTSQLEMMGYRLINKPSAIFKTNNKYLGTSLVKKTIRVPKTYLISKYLKNFQKIPQLLNFPFIIKPIISIQGKGVVKIENQEQLDNYLNKLNRRKLIGSPRFVQEFIPFDKLVRVVMVGQEVIDAAYDKPKDGWQCSVCLNPNVKPYPLNEKLKKISLKVKQVTGQEICMLDLFEKDGEYIFNEINNQCDLSFMQQATGINHAKKIAEYLISQAKRKAI